MYINAYPELIQLNHQKLQLCICHHISAEQCKSNQCSLFKQHWTLRSASEADMFLSLLQVKSQRVQDHVGIIVWEPGANERSGYEPVRLAACHLYIFARCFMSILQRVQALSALGLCHIIVLFPDANTVLPRSRQNTLTTLPAPVYSFVYASLRACADPLMFRMSIAVSWQADCGDDEEQ